MTFPLTGKNSIPKKLKILRYLQPRTNFSAAQNSNYKNLSKGYEGECKFHDILQENLSTNYLMISNSLLKVNQTEFQIDMLLLGDSRVYLLEVKNYDGNFYIQDDNWYVASSDNQIRNPVHQLKRSELLLQNLLKQTGFNIPTEPLLIFINPEFYLYQASLYLPAVFPTQIKRFIKRLNAVSFHQTDLHKDLSKSLIDHQIQQSAYEQLPTYQYEELRKGLICQFCDRYLSLVDYKSVLCEMCDRFDNLETAVKRSILEFTTLFPTKKVTTNSIHEWCHIIKSKKTIRRILKKHMISVGKGRHTYYIFTK